MNDNAIVVREDGEIVERERPLEVSEVTALVGRVHGILKHVMKPGTGKGDGDYDVIPGCGKKPVLLKPGAEKLSMAFGLLPRLMIELRELGGGHREYTVTCNLEGRDGGFRGQGVGSCSTLESKYRYRNAADYEILDSPIPGDAKEKKQEYRKQGYGMKQVDGAWCWVRYTSEGKVENPDIADVYNTCLKMAKKRALIDAVLTATAASDIFTQDIDDNPGAFGAKRSEWSDPPEAPTETPPPTATEPRPSPYCPKAPAVEPPDPLAGPSAPPAGSTSVISEKQGKLFYARAKTAGYSDDEIRAKVREAGFDHTRNITKGAFDDLLTWASGGEL